MREKQLSTQKNALYNSAGAIFYYLCQWAITVVAVRLSGDYKNTGFLQLSISITNIFFTIACFLPRTVQISDFHKDFSSEEYVGIRAFTSVLAFLLCFVYAFLCHYRGKAFLCIIIYMGFKISEAMSDVFRGFAQIHYRMDLEFVSYFIRGLSSLCTFSLILWKTQDVALALLSMAAVAFLIVAVLDVSIARHFVSAKGCLSIASVRKAMLLCWPIVLATLLETANASIPRQILEKISGTEALGYYASIATPIVFIQLLATSVFNPMLSDFTAIYQKKDVEALKKFQKTVLLGVVLLSLVSFSGAYLVGEVLYSLLYGDSIRAYCYLMYAVVGCAVLCVMQSVLGNILVVVRRQRPRMMVSCLGTLFVIAAARPMISLFHLNGVSFCTMACYLICTIGYYCLVRKSIRAEFSHNVSD